MSYKLDAIFAQNFLRVPRTLIRKFDLNTAIMFSEIYSEHNYYLSRDKLQNDNTFYSTIENVFYNTGLSKHQQSVACKILQANKLISVKYHDMPRKRYFKLNLSETSKLYYELESDINAYLEPINQPRTQECDTLDIDLPDVNRDKSVNITTQIEKPCQEHIIRQSNITGFSF